MILLASVLPCLLGAPATGASTPSLLTRVGELLFQPGFEVRRDSFVSLAPVQSVSFRGTRWTAREFYVRFKRSGKDVEIQWLEPLPGEGKTIVDTAYGPFSWRDGQLTKTVELSATTKTPLRVQLDSAASLETSLGWLETRRLVLGKDGSVTLPEDSLWLRLRTEFSFQASRTLLHGPLSWSGAFPRQPLPASNTTSALKIDSLWLSGTGLEAKGVRHCPAQDTCRNYADAQLSLGRQLLKTSFEPDGHWPLSPELGFSWKGAAAVLDGTPRFSATGLLVNLARPAGLTSGWCDVAGSGVASDSVTMVAASEREFSSSREVFRCDDQGLLWKGRLQLRWNGQLGDGPLWAWSFQPTGIGIAGLVDEYGKPFRVFDSTVRDSFQAGGIEALLRALPTGLAFQIRDRNFPVVRFQAGDTTSLHIVFSNGSRARVLSGKAALACSPTDTFPKLPIPILLHRAGACLELENPPASMTFSNAGEWGSLRPDKIWTMRPFGNGYELSGSWIPAKPIRTRFKSDSLRAEVTTKAPSENLAYEQPDAAWSATVHWTVPVTWLPVAGLDDLSGRSTLSGDLAYSLMRLTYQSPPHGPPVWKRLAKPSPATWKGQRVGLASAQFYLGSDAKTSGLTLHWSTFATFDRIEHPWGWIYQFDRPAPAKFLEEESTEIFQDPTHFSRMSLPEDGNPNPVAKGLPRPLTPPLPAWSEPNLPYKSLPAPPVRSGRAALKLDSLVNLPIDRLMASVAMYDSCVAAGKCTPVLWDSLSDTGMGRMWKTRGRWPESAQNGLTGSQAEAFCSFRGGRLPTQIEWRTVLRRALSDFDSLRDLSGLKALEHWCRTSPQIPGQLKPWNHGLFDLVGNGAAWCQGGKPCEIPSDSTCLPPVDERWTVGVRCVE